MPAAFDRGSFVLRLILPTAVLLTFADQCVAGEKTSFDQQVAPILAEHCLGCHSGAKPKGGLDLTSAKAVLKGTKRSPAVVAGKPAESSLWLRVDAGEMPPKKPLSADQKAILKTWIAKGAAWETDPIDPLRMTTKHRAGFDWWSLQPLRSAHPPKSERLAEIRSMPSSWTDSMPRA